MMTKYAALGIWDYFPNQERAELELGPSVVRNLAFLEFGVAGCFTLLALIDSFYFVFHPF